MGPSCMQSTTAIKIHLKNIGSCLILSQAVNPSSIAALTDRIWGKHLSLHYLEMLPEIKAPAGQWVRYPWAMALAP